MESFLSLSKTAEVIIPLDDVRQKLKDELSYEKALDDIFELTNIFEDSLDHRSNDRAGTRAR